ncbi:CRHBP [Cordylochernes scorpioides]|uniref:CRHBP n=1 Tax=Cordylochernes scorpioides TaxID=51811 RepID=A0ABY6JWX3_9ARAC|nr:CRHBP [Cordylochernes scorpioides]
MRDYVEIRGGSGLDPARMALAEDFCGTDSIPGKNALEVSCSNTAIRLVSSGDYENSVTFGMELLLEPTFLSLRCPDFHGLF